jgi:hypothetical protein
MFHSELQDLYMTHYKEYQSSKSGISPLVVPIVSLSACGVVSFGQKEARFLDFRSFAML